MVGSFFTINYIALLATAGIGMASDKRQQVTTLLYFDLIHLMGLDDLNICYRVGQRFPQVRKCNGIAHLQAVDMPKVIRTFPPTMSCDDAVGVVVAYGCRSIAQYRRACGEVGIGRAQIDGHGQLHSGYLQHANDLILDAVCHKVSGRRFTGFEIGKVTLFFRVKLAVLFL